MEAAHDLRRLGDILLEHARVSDEELQSALAEQRRTGQPLGAILVARGVVDGSTVAMALAEQEGRAVRSEYGWATGWGASAPRPADGPETLTEATAPAGGPAAELVGLDDAIAAKRRELDAVVAQLHEARVDLEALRRGEVDDADFVVVAVVENQYVLQLGRGTPPPVGSVLQLAGTAQPVVVNRDRWRHCLYAAPA